jgi:dTDP-4-amino-4,6-dideoxygalactose transaminase
MRVPFHKPYAAPGCNEHVAQALAQQNLAGNGPISHRAAERLQQIITADEVILTASCSAALEMCARLLQLKAGDEIIAPAFTHPATVSAFAAAGAAIRWIDIQPRTKVLDANQVARLITPQTKALVAVHYAGVSADMAALRNLCEYHGILLIEDAATALGAACHGKPLGSWGDLAVFSFHQTKNIQCGEGGALCVNNPQFIPHARLLQHCGTDKAAFLQGAVPAYTWQVLSSNYLMSELQAAFLLGQLEQTSHITSHLLDLWQHYFSCLQGVVPEEQLPLVEPCIQHNGHCFAILCRSSQHRQECIIYLQQRGIEAVFHYQPLHRAPVWNGAYREVSLPVTELVADRILRLPLHMHLRLSDVDLVCDALIEFLTE